MWIGGTPRSDIFVETRIAYTSPRRICRRLRSAPCGGALHCVYPTHPTPANACVCRLRVVSYIFSAQMHMVPSHTGGHLYLRTAKPISIRQCRLLPDMLSYFARANIPSRLRTIRTLTLSAEGAFMSPVAHTTPYCLLHNPWPLLHLLAPTLPPLHKAHVPPLHTYRMNTNAITRIPSPRMHPRISRRNHCARITHPYLHMPRRTT